LEAILSSFSWSENRQAGHTVEGREIKNLTVVDDATHEALALCRSKQLAGDC
jgi:hypothetical protein